MQYVNIEYQKTQMRNLYYDQIYAWNFSRALMGATPISRRESNIFFKEGIDLLRTLIVKFQFFFFEILQIYFLNQAKRS